MSNQLQSSANGYIGDGQGPVAGITRREALKAGGITVGGGVAAYIGGKALLENVLTYVNSGKTESELAHSPSVIRDEIRDGTVDPNQLTMVHAPEAENVDGLTGQITADSGENQTINDMIKKQVGGDKLLQGQGVIVPTADINSHSIFAKH